MWEADKEIQNFGWLDRPEEVTKVVQALPIPHATGQAIPMVDENQEMFLYDMVRVVNSGKDLDKGPQGIGDCTSFGWGGSVDTLQCVAIYKELKAQSFVSATVDADGRLVPMLSAEGLQLVADKIASGEFDTIATEAMYGLSRCQVGGQWNDYEDGGVGAWCAKAVTTFGDISRAALVKAGLSGPYDPKRAKEWGAKGLPTNLLPEAKDHLCKNTSLVTNFKDAAALIQNGYPVAVCSNRGFTMTRDKQGFASPKGVWNHCMKFIGVRWDRPGLCCIQSWGPNTPSGPLDKGQPDNSFFVDANVVDYMLGQKDSFALSDFTGYKNNKLIDWSH